MVTANSATINGHGKHSNESQQRSGKRQQQGTTVHEKGLTVALTAEDYVFTGKAFSDIEFP